MAPYINRAPSPHAPHMHIPRVVLAAPTQRSHAVGTWRVANGFMHAVSTLLPLAMLWSFCACQTTPLRRADGVTLPSSSSSSLATDAESCPGTCRSKTVVPDAQQSAKRRPAQDRRPSSEAYLAVLQGELHVAQAEYPAAIQRYREALVYDRDSDELTLRLGELYALSGDFERALANATRVIQRSPDSLPGAQLYARALMWVGEQEKALRFLQEATQTHPMDRDLSEMLAQQYIERGETQAAERVIENWMAYDPSAIDGYVTLASLFGQRGETAPALHYLELALRRNPHAPAALELQRDLFYAQGDFESALSSMRQLSSEEGDSLPTRRELLLAQLLAQGLDAGHELTDIWLQTDNSMQLRLGLSSSYEAAGHPDAALDLLLQADRNGPQRLRAVLETELVRLAHRVRNHALVERRACTPAEISEEDWRQDFLEALCVRALAKNGKPTLAATRLRRASDGAPASWRLLSIWTEWSGRPEFGLSQAETEHRVARALKHAPHAIDVLEVVALWHENNGAPQKARDLLEKHADQMLERDERWMVLARHFARQGNPHAAIELAEETLTQRASSQTLNFVAFTMAEHGIRLSDALPYAEQALVRAPLEGYIVDTVGWTHFRRGDNAKAIYFLRIANRLAPDEPEILFHLAKALAANGSSSEAIVHLEAAEKWEPDESLAQRIRTLLAELRGFPG